MPPKERKVLMKPIKPKRERRVLSIGVKLDVIKRIEDGQRSKDICQALDLSSSTVRTIYINKEKIQKTAESVVGSNKLKMVSKVRNPVYEKLENVLMQWVEDQTKGLMTISFSIIQQKAISLFKDLKRKAIEEGDETAKDIEFKASNGWFDRFKKRGFLYSPRITDKAVSTNIQPTSKDIKPTSIDIQVVDIFPAELSKVIKEGGYHPKVIFNIADTGLFWKRIMLRTSISEEEKKSAGYKASKDKLTLLFGGNLNGDVKLKPLLIYHSKNPKAFKGLNKNSFPVIWRSNKKGWMTQQVFFDYVQNSFCPFVEKYCLENNFRNRALLIIGNTLGHPSSIVDYGDNVQIVFLPPNSTSLLQPMDQGVISTFKTYYLQLVMKYLVDGLNSSDSDNVSTKDLWKNYNIKMAVENIGTAWEKLSEKTMNVVWKKLLPESVRCVEDIRTIENNIKDDIVKLANRAGFEHVDKKDVQQILDSHTEELTDEELIQRNAEGLDEAEEQEDELPNEMDTKSLRKYFALISNANAFLNQNDGNLERIRQVKIGINEVIQCYRDLYERKVLEAKQTNSLSSFHSVRASDFQPSTSVTSFKPKHHKLSSEEDEKVVDFIEVSYNFSSPPPSFAGSPSPPP